MGGSGNTPYDIPRAPAPTSRGGGGGGSGGGEPDDFCAGLAFPAVISSPNPAVVATLGISEVLAVVLGGKAGVPLVELHTSDGRVAGTLTSNLPDILRCLNAGNSYEAEVLSVSGGAVRVHVRSA